MNKMEPLTLLAWVGVIALSIVIVSIAVLVVWTVVQTIRGKAVTKSGRR
jgi:hypothetical protein